MTTKQKLCSVPSCGDPVRNRGWCSTHYNRWRLTGDAQTYKPKRPYGLTLEKRMDKSGSCWLWLGTQDDYGYGVVKIGGKTVRAHRATYEQEHGYIPKGLFVCHACDNPLCVNPDHLFLGTHTDNMRDMVQKGRHYLTARTHCKRGHAFTEDNIYHPPNKPSSRTCRRCITLRAKERKQR